MKTTHPREDEENGIILQSGEQLLLNDIIINIARQDGWNMSGTLARCSKPLLKTFLHADILIEIVNHLKSNPKNRMLKWLVLSLPSQFVLLPPGFNQTKIYESLTYKPQSWHEFITGGHVTQKIYALQWDSDIDVYCHNGQYDDNLYKKSYNATKIDRIYSDTLQLEEVIEYFDISIVQQGYKDDNNYYLTPLSLYTFYSKDIIVSPSDLNIDYLVPHKIVKGNSRLERIASDLLARGNQRVIIKRNIWHYIRSCHNKKNHNSNVFDQCPKCSSKFYRHTTINKWISRIQKYRTRFPNFTFTYCLPTALHDLGDEETENEIDVEAEEEDDDDDSSGENGVVNADLSDDSSGD